MNTTSYVVDGPAPAQYFSSFEEAKRFAVAWAKENGPCRIMPGSSRGWDYQKQTPVRPRPKMRVRPTGLRKATWARNFGPNGRWRVSGTNLVSDEGETFWCTGPESVSGGGNPGYEIRSFFRTSEYEGDFGKNHRYTLDPDLPDQAALVARVHKIINSVDVGDTLSLTLTEQILVMCEQEASKRASPVVYY